MRQSERNAEKLDGIMKKVIKRIFSLTGILILVWMSNVSAMGQIEPPNSSSLVVFTEYFNNEPVKLKRELLSMLVKELLDRPDHTAHIISYGNGSKVDCEAVDNLKFVHAFIQGGKKIPAKRVMYVNGGYRSRGMTEIYLVPPGAEFPDRTTPINDVLNPQTNQKNR